MKLTTMRRAMGLVLTFTIANATMLGFGTGPDAGVESISGESVEVLQTEAIVGGQSWFAILGCATCFAAAGATWGAATGLLVAVGCGVVCYMLFT